MRFLLKVEKNKNIIKKEIIIKKYVKRVLTRKNKTDIILKHLKATKYYIV